MQIAHVVVSPVSVGTIVPTALVVADLCAELARQGHRAHTIDADSLPMVALSPSHTLRGSVAPLALVVDQLDAYDVVHVHSERPVWGFSRGRRVPTLTTLRCILESSSVGHAALVLATEVSVAVCAEQRTRAPALGWKSTVLDGLDRRRYPFVAEVGSCLAFVGPSHRFPRAMAIAQRAGVPLRILGGGDRGCEPLDLHQARRLGIDVQEAQCHEDWVEMLGDALALVVSGPSNAGLGSAVAQALAVGTPVVAFADANVAEFVRPGVTGFIIDSVSDAVEVLDDVRVLERDRCNLEFERTLTVEHMARAYLDLYDGLSPVQGRMRPRSGPGTRSGDEGCAPPKLTS